MKMKLRYFLSSLMLLLVILYSCKKELEPQDSSVPTDRAPMGNPANSQANTGVQPTTQPVLPENLNATKTGINPPHGQVEHKCDIAVGARLDSPPGKTAPKTAMSSTVTNLQQNITANQTARAVVTKAGMNPPHGQAGHRCDISVGASLDSKLNTKTAGVAVTNPNAQIPTLLKVDSTAVNPK